MASNYSCYLEHICANLKAVLHIFYGCLNIDNANSVANCKVIKFKYTKIILHRALYVFKVWS